MGTRRTAEFRQEAVRVALTSDLMRKHVAVDFGIGFSTLSNRMKRNLAIRALDMAVALRKPPRGCIHHWDRGSQYCSHDYQKLLRLHGKPARRLRLPSSNTLMASTIPDADIRH